MISVLYHAEQCDHDTLLTFAKFCNHFLLPPPPGKAPHVQYPLNGAVMVPALKAINLSEACQDFLFTCLVVHPARRPTAAQLLAQPYMAGAAAAARGGGAAQ